MTTKNLTLTFSLALGAALAGLAGAPALLAERVRKGGKGVWGPIPMAPTTPDKLSDADLKAVIAWILQAR